MTAIYKAPGELPEIIDVENTLEALQEKVGGYIEAVTMPGGAACVLCNEEGRLRAAPDNITLLGVDFVGPILVVGIAGEDFCDLDDAEFLHAVISVHEVVRRNREAKT